MSTDPFATPHAPAGDPLPVYDLGSLLSAIGNPTYAKSGMEPLPRRDSPVAVEMLEEGTHRVTEDALPAKAYLDGIQSAFVVTHREHRPVIVAYTSAGAIGAGLHLHGTRDDLRLIVSAADAEWAGGINSSFTPIPVTVLDETLPPMIEGAAAKHLSDARARSEVELAGEVLDAGVVPLVVDGSLQGHPCREDIFGVVKTSNTRYLKNETVLYSLAQGHRSSIFRIPAHAGNPERYSCYLRLHDASNHPWSHALIRLEAFFPDWLPNLAAAALNERQEASSGDARWDRHLGSVAACEKVLRSRRPWQFDLAR